jgi:hypothetical protein
MQESLRRLTKEFTRDLETATAIHSEKLRAEEEAWMSEIISVGPPLASLSAVILY